MRRIRPSVALSILPFLFPILAAALDVPRPPDVLPGAGEVARGYLLAQFRGEYAVMGRLAHSSLKNRLCQLFWAEHEGAQKRGDEQRFLSEWGISGDLKTIRGYKVEELFVYLLKANAANAPDSPPAPQKVMKRAEVKVLGQEAGEHDSVRVDLEVDAPGPKGPLAQKVWLILAREKGEWRVAR
jgi:hypothetical protein